MLRTTFVKKEKNTLILYLKFRNTFNNSKKIILFKHVSWNGQRPRKERNTRRTPHDAHTHTGGRTRRVHNIAIQHAAALI